MVTSTKYNQHVEGFAGGKYVLRVRRPENIRLDNKYGVGAFLQGAAVALLLFVFL